MAFRAYCLTLLVGVFGSPQVPLRLRYQDLKRNTTNLQIESRVAMPPRAGCGRSVRGHLPGERFAWRQRRRRHPSRDRVEFHQETRNSWVPRSEQVCILKIALGPGAGSRGSSGGVRALARVGFSVDFPVEPLDPAPG